MCSCGRRRRCRRSSRGYRRPASPLVPPDAPPRRARAEGAAGAQAGPGQPMVDIAVNEAVIEGLSSALERARERGLVVGGLTAGDLLRFPQAISIADRKEESPDAAIPPAVEA